MANIIEDEKLISHSTITESIESTIKNIARRIQEQGDKPHVTVKYQLELLQEMKQFKLGKFLIQNQGLNGYWTHYVLTYPWIKKSDERNSKPSLEQFLLERAPTLLATQQRFRIFLQENQKSVRDDSTLASIPCGMMGELLYLNFSGRKNVQLIGIDYDTQALEEAKSFSEKQKIRQQIMFCQNDAWNLSFFNEIDLISSNGLNIYESSTEKVKNLYHRFFCALKPKGRLVTSFLTYPPSYTNNCEWDLKNINQSDLLLQQIIFSDILNAKWQCFRSTNEIKEQLESIGFKNINFLYDKARIFPTVTAEK